MKIKIFIFISILLLGCNNTERKVLSKSLVTERDLEIEIINSVLKELIPLEEILNARKRIDNDSLKLSVYVNETLLIASDEVVDEFVSNGASDLLAGIIDKEKFARDMKCWLLRDFDNIHVTSLAPLTTKEQLKSIGGVNFSRIIFNDEKTKAAFIFDFSNRINKSKDIFCAIEVQKKDIDWQIISQVCITKKFPFMLNDKMNKITKTSSNLH